MVKKARKTAPKTRSERTNPTISDQRQALFLAILPHIAFDGFSLKALETGAKDMQFDIGRARLLFPSPTRDLLQYFMQWSNGELADALKNLHQKNWKIREKVSYGVRKKLEILAPWREAERKAVKLLANPRYADLALRTLYDTCDIIWRAAGDTATDWNFYSKRTLLAGVYSSTLLFWLQDDSDDFEDSWQFLSRRIDNVMTIEKIKSAFKNRERIKSGMEILKKVVG